MPLFKYRPGMTKKEKQKVVYKNYAIERRHGKSRKQSFAIAYHAAGEK